MKIDIQVDRKMNIRSVDREVNRTMSVERCRYFSVIYPWIYVVPNFDELPSGHHLFSAPDQLFTLVSLVNLNASIG